LSALDSQFDYCSVNIGDVENVARLLATFQPDIVLHLASSLRGDAKSDLLATNVTGTESLFAGIVLSGGNIPRVVVASSGGVYGEVDARRLPSREFDDCAPADNYSLSKLLAEKSARHAAAADRIPLAIARIFNVLGPGQDERHVAGKIAAQLMSIRQGWTDEVSLGVLHCTRDFIDVRDVARALIMLGDKGEGTFNIGTGSELPVSALLTEFLTSSRILAKVRSECYDGGVTRSWADISRLRELGFERQYSLHDSVVAILDYYAQLWNTL
jgi:GDP-4-dehydro-6-deoxy-D-mannose reductase